MVQQILKTKRGKWAAFLVIFSAIGVVASLSNGSTETLPWVLILITVAVALTVSVVRSIKNPSPPPAQHTIKSNGINLTVSTKTTETDVSWFLADGEEISRLDLGWSTNPSGGFVNWSVYEVAGINQVTGRKNTRKYDAKNEQGAVEVAKKDGLVEPYDVQPCPHDAPTEKQINYLLSWNTTLPNGASKYDVSAILDRLEDSYDTIYEKQVSEREKHNYIRPLPGPSIEFAKYADEMGLYFSSFIGDDVLFERVVNTLDMRDRIAFFAYCALCSYHRFDIGNLLSSPYKDRLYEFANVAIQDDSIVKSMEQRTPYDYRNIHKGTKVYKAVAEFFSLK